MTRYRVFLVIALLLMAGCIGNSGTYPDGPAVLSFSGDMSTDDGEFRMNGTVVVGGGVKDQDVYRNVTVNLYADNGTKYLTKEAGDIEWRSSVVLRTETVPEYIVIWSSDFDDSNARTSYYTRHGEGYRAHTAKNWDEMPVEPSG